MPSFADKDSTERIKYIQQLRVIETMDGLFAEWSVRYDAKEFEHTKLVVVEMGRRRQQHQLPEVISLTRGQ